MSDTPKLSAQIQIELDAAIAEHARLTDTIHRCEQELKIAAELRAKLSRSAHGGPVGLIHTLRSNLAAAKLRESDATLPRVVFVKRGYGFSDGEYVVSRVTPKRIFIRQVGHSDVDQFHRDGAAVRSWIGTAIDIPATFPNGVKIGGGK